MPADRGAALVLALLALAPAAWGADPQPERQRSLVHLMRHDCGSCHGMTLGGGLGPPLTAPALRDRDPAALEAVILHGRPGTPMPPWKGMLSDEDVRWMVRALQSGRLP